MGIVSTDKPFKYEAWGKESPESFCRRLKAGRLSQPTLESCSQNSNSTVTYVVLSDGSLVDFRCLHTGRVPCVAPGEMNI